MINEKRTGNFTSSSIYMLASCGNNKDSIGAPFFTYVKEKRREIRVGRSIQNDSISSPTEWGDMCEQYIIEKLPLEYNIDSEKRYYHESLPWNGAPDGIKNTDKKVSLDIKSPFTLTSFMDTIEIFEMDNIELGLKKGKKDWYWQAVSNMILSESISCEQIIFMPERSDLEELREFSYENGYKFHTEFFRDDYRLPWTADYSEFKSITHIPFNPPQEDVDFLIKRVELATKCLNYKGKLSIKEYVKQLKTEQDEQTD